MTVDPWKMLTRIAWCNLAIGLLIWSRAVAEFIQMELGPIHGNGFFRIALIIDFAMGVQCILSGGLLRRRHAQALLVTALAGGACYSNALFGLILTLPQILYAGSSAADEPLRTASLGAHFVQSAVLMLYWTGVTLIVLGDLKHGRLEDVYPSQSRPTVLVWGATAASSMALVQIVLRLFS